MPKINQEEYVMLKEIRRNGFEEIRRNSTGDIAVRSIGEKVTSHQYQTEHNDKFKFLEATGDYWSIGELIEEYETPKSKKGGILIRDVLDMDNLDFTEEIKELNKMYKESEETEANKLNKQL